MFNIKESGKQSVKVPGLLGEKGEVQCIWSTAVSRIIHEAGVLAVARAWQGAWLLSVCPTE